MDHKILETEETLVLDEAFADPELELDATQSQNIRSQMVLHHCC